MPTTAQDRMGVALRTGNSSGVTEKEILDQIPSSLDARRYISYDLIASDVPITWLLDANTAFVTDPGPLQPILTGNKNLKPGNYPNNHVLAIAGRATNITTRFAYFGGNPFVTNNGGGYGQGPWNPVSDPGMVAFDQNVVAWLLDTTSDSTRAIQKRAVTQNIVLSGLNDGFESATRIAIARLFPNARINGGRAGMNNVCDFTGSSNPCLSDADLLVVGDNRNPGDDAVAAAVVQAHRNGLPLLIMTENGNYSPDSWKIAAQLGITLGQNYFMGQTVIDNTPKSYQAPTALVQDEFANDTTQIRNFLNGSPLNTSDYAACISADGVSVGGTWFSSCVPSPPAGIASRAIPYFAALTRMRAIINSINAGGYDLFSASVGDRTQVLRLLALLAEKARNGPGTQPGDTAVAINYPISTRTNGLLVTRALFADWFYVVSTKATSGAKNLGSLWCPTRAQVAAGTCPSPQFPDVGTYALTLNSSLNDGWTSTGFTQQPGRAAAVTLTVDPRIPVYVRTFGTKNDDARTGQYSSRGVSLYDRPQWAISTWIRLVPGVATTVNAPYGGPLYVRTNGINTNNTRAVSLVFANVSRHLAALDVSNDTSVAQLARAMMTTSAYWVDIVGTGFEIHSPAEKLMTSLSSAGINIGTGRNVYYNDTTSGLMQLIRDFRDSWAEREYRIAGLKIDGETLSQSLPSEVQQVCSFFRWPCLDENTNTRTEIQHVAYDTYSACGDLCSGNPITISGSPSPIGFGEGHELGHNLQLGVLNIQWPDTQSGTNMAAVNWWTSYSERSIEVSNNFFPTFVQWTYFRVTLPTRTGRGVDNGVLLHHDPQCMTNSFGAYMSAYNRLQLAGSQVVLDSRCNVLQSFPIGTRPDAMLADAIWQDPAYAADNGIRQSIYLQLPQIMQDRTLANGRRLADGRNMYTLLYLAARSFYIYSRNATAWGTYRDRLGFNRYDFNNNAVYGTGRAVSTMIGNDFLLVQLCRTTGFDFRPYFAAHGVFYTSLANTQVLANAPAGGYRVLGQPHVVLGTQLPLTNLTAVPPGSAGAYTTNDVYIDSTNLSQDWPGADNDRNGVPDSFVGWHPTQCRGVTAPPPY